MHFKGYSLLLLAAAFLALPLTANAQGQSLMRADGSTEAGPYVELDHGPQVIERGGEEVTITHSASTNIVSPNGVACPTAPNSYWRVFDLDEFELTGGLEVTSVDLGIESVGVEQTTEVNLYVLDGEFVTENLTLVSTEELEISAFDDLSVVNVPITGSFAAGDVLAVEWAVPETPVFFGGNPEGQTAPTYIQAEACGATEPTDIASLGDFPDAAWVLYVHGTTTGTANEDEAVAQSVSLGQNYPNPVLGRTTVPFSLENAQQVRISVVDALGREVLVAADEAFAAGPQTVELDLTGLPSGVYVYRVATETETISQKLVVMQ